MNDLERTVRELADRDEIRQLVARYCHFLHTRAFRDIVDLFTPDGVLEPPGTVVAGVGAVGGDDLLKLLAGMCDAHDPWPFAHNHVIDLLDEDNARGVVYVETRLGSEAMRTANVNVYHDTYARVGGAWRFQARNVSGVLIPEEAGKRQS